MIAPIVLLALAAGPVPARPLRWSRLEPSQRAARLRLLEAEPLARRILDVSAGFLGTPYQHSPLGEGTGPDPDPLIRFDRLDCLTFVEETMALSLSPDPAHVLPLLLRIRYATRPRYEDRNHLMEAEWIPVNEAKGFVRDVTVRYGGADVIRTEKWIPRGAWKTPRAQALGLPAAKEVTGHFPLAVIPLDRMALHAAAIPSGTVALVVRQERTWTVTRITHLGLIVHEGGRTYFRHASSTPAARVVDEPLEHFLQRNAAYQRWPVVGFSLLQILPRTEEVLRARRSAFRRDAPVAPEHL